MKPANCVTSILFFTLLLAGCAHRPTPLALPTETAIPDFIPMFTTPVQATIPTNTLSSSSTLKQTLRSLSSLSLPEFNARYTTRDIALTSDRQIMAVISKDRLHGEESVWLWNVSDFDHSLIAYQNVINDPDSIAFSQDGSQLAIGGEGMIVILDWKSGERLEPILFPNPGSNSIQISFGPNNTLLSSYQNGQLTIWDLAKKEAKYSVEITAGPGLFSSFALSPDGTTLVAGLYEETNLWDFKTGQLKDIIKNPGDTDLTSFVYSLDGKWIATGGCNKFGFETCVGGQVLIWNSSFEGPSITISNYPSNVGVLEFSPKGNSLGILNSGVFELLDLGTGQSMRAPSLGHPAGKLSPAELYYTFDMNFLSDGSLVAVSTTEGIQLLDVKHMSWMANLRFILSLGFPYSVTAEGDNLNLRMEPSMEAGIKKKLHTGESFVVFDGPKIVDNQVWWKVKIEDDTEGWIAEMPGWYEFVP